MITNTGTAILERLLQAKRGNLSAGTAREILRLDFPQADHQRMGRLSAKAQCGTLTPDEQAELAEYLRVADLLALFQSKARISLKKRAGTAS
jgi:hypothetical protein